MKQRYIGIDAHSSSCTLAVMGPTGKRIKEWLVETDRGTLMDAVRSVAGERYVCFEEGTLSDWLYETLEPLTKNIDVVHPPKRMRGNKNDSSDAWALAEAMRVQNKEVVRVFKQPRKYTMLRKAARAYQVIQRDVVRVKNRIHASYRARGLSGLGDAIYDPERRQNCMAQLPPGQQGLVEHYCRELDGLTAVHDEARRWLLEEAEKQPIVELLETAPGIGTIRASLIVATIMSPERFRTSRQLWSYCGLGIVTRSSSDWSPHEDGWRRNVVRQNRGLNRNRNPLLKEVFKGAAFTLTSSKMAAHPLHQAYQRLLKSGTKPNLARLTLARRIAAVVLAMWKKKEAYDPARQVPAS
jgi:transposase